MGSADTHSADTLKKDELISNTLAVLLACYFQQILCPSCYFCVTRIPFRYSIIFNYTETNTK
uniref:Uncharacterized protein n=1 Tax=Anguilla anguilla TaxID=7936 RepID=A0A0E9SWM5_ANGAN